MVINKELDGQSRATFFLVLTLFLTVCATISTNINRPGYDYYQFWIIGQALKQGQTDFYNFESREKLLNKWRAKFDLPTTKNGIYTADKATGDTNDDPLKSALKLRPRLFATASPFFYSIFSIPITGNYKIDFFVFQAASVFSFFFAVYTLSRLFGHSVSGSLLLLILFTVWFNPYWSDNRANNVSQIQLLFLTGYFFIRSKEAPGKEGFLSGIFIGLISFMKLNLLLGPVFLILFHLISGNTKRAFRDLSGCFVGGVLAVTISSFFFNGVTCWREFLNVIAGRDDVKSLYMAKDRLGNFSLSQFISQNDNLHPFSLAIISILIIVLAFFILQKFRNSQQGANNEFTLDSLLVCSGLLTFLLVSPVSWVHYYILCIPIIILLCSPKWSNASRADKTWLIVTLIAAVVIALEPLEASTIFFTFGDIEFQDKKWLHLLGVGLLLIASGRSLIAVAIGRRAHSLN